LHIEGASAATSGAQEDVCSISQPVSLTAEELAAGTLPVPSKKLPLASVQPPTFTAGMHDPRERSTTEDVESMPASPLPPFRICLPGAWGVQVPLDLETFGPGPDTLAPRQDSHVQAQSAHPPEAVLQNLEQPDPEVRFLYPIPVIACCWRLLYLRGCAEYDRR
jgi:hypothetical protein